MFYLRGFFLLAIYPRVFFFVSAQPLFLLSSLENI